MTSITNSKQKKIILKSIAPLVGILKGNNMNRIIYKNGFYYAQYKFLWFWLNYSIPVYDDNFILLEVGRKYKFAYQSAAEDCLRRNVNDQKKEKKEKKEFRVIWKG